MTGNIRDVSAINFTSKDFDQNIKFGVVLVDFWATWCVDPATKVMTSRRESIVAGSVVEGSSLLSMGKTGLFIDRVDVAKVVADGGHCKHITTETGREISTTDDHLFFTNSGWKKAEDLMGGDKLAVRPTLVDVSTEIASDMTIVSAELIRKEKEIPNLNKEKYIQELTKRGLLPMMLSSPQLPILARIMGAVFSDGNLYLGKENNYREISFVLGTMKDVEDVVADLRSLGVIKVHISERDTENNIRGRKFMSHTFKVKVLSTAFWLLLVALGVPRGRKTDKAYRLPKWLKQASQLVQREFLAAYLGGDGPKVDIRLVKRKNKEAYNDIKINDLEFHKRSDLEKSGLDFAKDLTELLENFGVRVAKPFSEHEGIKWKNDRQSVIIHLRFKNDVETAYAMTNKIGYVYCNQKQQRAEMTGEFLARIRQRRILWRRTWTKAHELASAGVSTKDIASQLKINVGTVWGWIKQGKKATTNYYKEKFDNWLIKAKHGINDEFLWDVVSTITEVFLPQVARITVATNHNFVANGFVVHNCGPCRAAAPVIEEISVEYAGKITVGKVDVDAEGSLSQKYGVMSIPTIILFKDGVEIGRQVGFAGKQGYLDLLKKAGV